MKLIIDIPDNEYKQNRHYYDSVYHGVPLDDIKTEIDDEWANTHHMYPDYASGLAWASEIIDKHIDKADFPQAKDVEPTVENFSKVLDNKLIKDTIRDCGTDIKGSRCCTCKNSDDEFSGECYECIKGIFDHYEPEEDKPQESETDFPQAEDIDPTVKNFSKVLDNTLIRDATLEEGESVDNYIKSISTKTGKKFDDVLKGFEEFTKMMFKQGNNKAENKE